MGPADPRMIDLVGRLILDSQGRDVVARPPLIAVVGAQGSGKTTLASAAAACLACSSAFGTLSMRKVRSP